MNMTVNKIDTGNVILDNATHVDKTLIFPSALTYVAGTVLATLVAATTITVTPGANTGNGTVTAATVVAGAMVPQPGNYVLRCVTAVANGGVFRLEDPNGAVLATGITMTPGAGGATVYEVYGMQFTITDGATDFAAGDTFTLAVAAGGGLVAYDPAGAGGAQIATDVLTYDVTATGAGSQPIRSMVDGRVRKERLIIAPDTAVTDAVVEQLRRVGIVAVDVESLSQYDNEPA